MSEVGTVVAESPEAKVVKLEAERDARLTFEEARDRLLDALEDARQGCVTLRGHTGNLIGNLHDPDHAKASEAERRGFYGVQVVALDDLNAAVDRAFPVGGEEQ